MNGLLFARDARGSGDRSIVLRQPFPHFGAWGIASSPDFFTASVRLVQILNGKPFLGARAPHRRTLSASGFRWTLSRQTVDEPSRSLPAKVGPVSHACGRADVDDVDSIAAQTRAHMLSACACLHCDPTRPTRHVTSATSASLFGGACSRDGNRAHFLRTKARADDDIGARD